VDWFLGPRSGRICSQNQLEKVLARFLYCSRGGKYHHRHLLLSSEVSILPFCGDAGVNRGLRLE
jgi:hypothetical protein